MADKTYIPNTGPALSDLESVALSEWVQRELEYIAAAFQETPTVRLTVLNAAPAKPRNGMLVYADGTNWNPGSGAGVYAYEGGSWVKL